LANKTWRVLFSSISKPLWTDKKGLPKHIKIQRHTWGKLKNDAM
jgi:hypothetical protein